MSWLQDHRKTSRLVTALVLGLTPQLSGCILFNEFKTDGLLVKDDCFKLVAASLCVDFDSGQLDANGIHAEVGNQANCKSIKKITITGFVDKNDNGTEDEGESIESTEHEVAESEGSNSVTVGDLSLALNADSSEASDVHIVIAVERTDGGGLQRYRKKIRKC